MMYHVTMETLLFYRSADQVSSHTYTTTTHCIWQHTPLKLFAKLKACKFCLFNFFCIWRAQNQWTLTKPVTSKIRHYY